MILLFDIGGTNMRFSLAEGSDLIGETLIVDTPKDYQQALQLIKECFDKVNGDDKIDKIAGGIAGVFNSSPVKHLRGVRSTPRMVEDLHNSVLVNSPNLPNWSGKPIKKDLGEIFGIEPILENDADLAGLGEAVYGAGKNYRIVAYLSIGTGIGGTRIVDGKIDANVYGFEPGHHFLDFDGSFAGKICDFEDLASGTAIEKKYGVSPDKIKDENIWDEMANIIAYGIHNTIVFWSPVIVILGGGVSQSLPIEKITSRLKHISTIFPEIPEIKKSELADKSALYGALELLSSRA